MTEETKSLSEIISESYDEIQSESTDTSVEETSTLEATEPLGVDTFEVDTTIDTAAEPLTATETETPEAETTQSATATIDPPISWKGEMKEKFYTLPLDVQETISLREAQLGEFISNRQSDFDKANNQLSGFNNILDPLKDRLAAQGITATDYINRLVASDKLLSENPVSGLRKLASNFDISMNEVLSDEPVQKIDSSQISNLQEQIQQIKSLMEQQQVDSRTQVMSESNNAITEFANQKDSASGQLLFPYFNDVQDDMSYIVSRLKQTNPSASNQELLTIAYNKAIRLNDALWEKQVSKMQTSDVASVKKQQVNKAKLAASSITGAPQGTAPVTGNGDFANLKTLISEAYDELSIQ